MSRKLPILLSKVSTNRSLVIQAINAIFFVFPFTLIRTTSYLWALKTLFCTLTVFMTIAVLLFAEICYRFYDIPLFITVIYFCSVMTIYATNINISLISVLKRAECYFVLKNMLDNIAGDKKCIWYVSVLFLANSFSIGLVVYNQLRVRHDLFYCFTFILIDGYLPLRLIAGLINMLLIMHSTRKRIRSFNESLRRRSNAICVDHYLKVHDKFCEEVETIGNTFGLLLLFIVFYFIATYLRHASFIAWYLNVSLIQAPRALLLLLYGFQAGYLAHIGQQIRNESQNTVAICYRLMPKPSFNYAHGNVNSELFRLAQQAFNRKNKISAAGFFNVDNSMVVFMATTFFTYFIVVMQILADTPT